MPEQLKKQQPPPAEDVILRVAPGMWQTVLVSFMEKVTSLSSSLLGRNKR